MAQIKIAVDNPELIFALFESGQVSDGMSREIPGGAKLTFATEYPNVEKPGVIYAIHPEITFVISFGCNVAAGVLGCWLYDKLNSKPTHRITIDRQDIEITQEGITRIITERLILE